MMFRVRPVARFIPFLAALVIAVAMVVGGGGTAMAQDLFFEDPRLVVPDNAGFPQVVSTGGYLVIVYQEYVPAEGGVGGQIYLSALRSTNGRDWQSLERFAGPVPYSRSLRPQVFSLRRAGDGALLVALVDGADTVRILRTPDAGSTVEEVAAVPTDATTVTPLLFRRSDGGLLLFVTQSIGGVQVIRYSRSDTGTAWSPLSALEDDVTIGTNFNPRHAGYQGREYVYFQTLNVTVSQNFQIYVKVSEDAGRTWSPPRLVTDVVNLQETDDYLDYSNQAPFPIVYQDRLYLAWQRRFRQFPEQVFFGEIATEGTLALDPEAVTPGGESTVVPGGFVYGDDLFITWTETTRSGSSVVMARRGERAWERREMGSIDGRSIRPSATVHDGRLHFVWQNDRGEDSAIVYREPDQRAQPPDLLAANFELGGRTRQAEAAFAWTAPPDPSGIEAYSYTWSQDPNAPVPTEEDLEASQRSLTLQAEEDGDWFLRVRALDRAGNWSEPSTISFTRDRTPPQPVNFARPALDEDGYLVSNTFDLAWIEPPDPDVDGYTLAFEYLAPVLSFPDIQTYQPPSLNPTVLSEATSISRDNLENGVYALSVSPIDTVGNVGEPRTLFVRLNKFVPFTLITSVSVQQDLLGRVRFGIVGRGFTDNGLIEQIVLDRDGREPWDYSFRLGDDDFLVRGNRLIEGPVISDVQTGEYLLTVFHEERGRYDYSASVAMTNPGTIKFGNYAATYRPGYRVVDSGLFSISAGSIVMWGVVAVCVILLVFSTFRVRAVVAESQTLRTEVRALITGAPLPSEEKRKRMQEMRKRGIGLRIKFTLFIVVLVIAVVVMVAYFLGTAALQNQERILAEGLRDRSTVLLDSMTTIVENTIEGLDTTEVDEEGNIIGDLTYLEAIAAAPTEFLEGVIDIPDQAEVIGAEYATITGPNPATGPGFEYVWATSDPLIQQASPENPSPRISTANYIPGTSAIDDDLHERAEEIRVRINTRLQDELAPLFDEVQRILQDLSAALREGRDVSDADQDLLRSLQQQIDRTLSGTAAEFRGSLPAYNPEDLPNDPVEYLFYEPILLTEDVGAGDEVGERIFYYGMVRLAVSTDVILAEIDEATALIIRNTVITALIAVAAGVIGSLILASITVIPINRLVRGVELIRDTEDKEKLHDHLIKVTTRDELNVLSDVINEMTRGLVKAAAANKDLTVGKEVQKMFIPLIQASDGRKLTTGKEETDFAEFFGYYEGAKGVSGDYFDFEKLDNEHYAIIKCDVAGKGVPAALIMVEVATIFLDHFKDWDGSQRGFDLSRLVSRINDLLEARGFKGRFAAFTVAILNARTGAMRIANAGDNQIHVYVAREGQVVQSTLAKTPAAGVFPSDMVPTGFPQEPRKLEAEDIFLFFTDGVEEAQRTLRTKDYKPYVATEEDVEGGRFLEPQAAKAGETFEELGLKRIHDIVNTAKHSGVYRLIKNANPEAPDDDALGALTFDFSTLRGTAEDVVLALVSIEKMFRIYAPPGAGPQDRVIVDRRIDEFLQEHCAEYQRYFHSKVVDDPQSEYVVFSHIKQDEQYDDLTLLAVRKK